MLGVTVLADYILSEGVDAVLDNLTGRAGVDAIACNPTVTVPATEGEGSFQPPVDGGTSPRLFDRPLWGKRSLWVKAEPSYRPNPRLYADSKYGPKPAGELTDRYGGEIRRFIDAAHAKGLAVYFQLPAAAPPGFTDEDAPRLPDGSVATERFARTASVASPAVAAYNRAYVKDLLAGYPDINGIRPDWPEYPCYTLGELFGDFSAHAETVARKSGEANGVEGLAVDFGETTEAVAEIWRNLHGNLSNDHAHWLRDELGVVPLAERADSGEVGSAVQPVAAAWLRLKSDVSVQALRNWRAALDEAGGDRVALSANAFAPPFSDLTGFDFARAASIADAVSPKLYTMHWLVIMWLWAKELIDANQGLTEETCVTAIASDLGLAGRNRALTLADVHYPEPDEPHAVADEPQIAAVERAAAAARATTFDGGGTGDEAGKAPRTAVTPIVHGYGPQEDFRRRFACAARSSADGVWVNRYGYLSDEKLDAIGKIWGARR